MLPFETSQSLEHLPTKEDVCERLCCGEEGKYNPVHHPFDLLKEGVGRQGHGCLVQGSGRWGKSKPCHLHPSPCPPTSLTQVQFCYTPSTLGANRLLCNQSESPSKTSAGILDLIQVSYALGQSPKELRQELEPVRMAASSRDSQRRDIKKRRPQNWHYKLSSKSCPESPALRALRGIMRLRSAWITEQESFTKITKLLAGPWTIKKQSKTSNRDLNTHINEIF